MAKFTIPLLCECPENDINAFFFYKYGSNCYFIESPLGIKEVAQGCPFEESVVNGTYMMDICSDTSDIDGRVGFSWWYSIEFDKKLARKMSLEGHLEQLALRFSRDIYCLNEDDELVIARVITDKSIQNEIERGITKNINKLHFVKFYTVGKDDYNVVEL